MLLSCAICGPPAPCCPAHQGIHLSCLVPQPSGRAYVPVIMTYSLPLPETYSFWYTPPPLAGVSGQSQSP